MIEARWFIKETVRGKDGQVVKGDDGKPKKEGPFRDAKGTDIQKIHQLTSLFKKYRFICGNYI